MLLFSPIFSFDAMLIVYILKLIGRTLSHTTVHFLQDSIIRKTVTILHDTVITAVADCLL